MPCVAALMVFLVSLAATSLADTDRPANAAERSPLEIIQDGTVPLHHRMEVVRMLIAHDPEESVPMLAFELAPGGHAAAQRTIAAVLADMPPSILSQFEGPLFAQLATPDEAILGDVCLALGRIDKHRTFNKLIRTTGDEAEPALARRGAVLALAHHPRRDVAATLINLTGADVPAEVRAAAFEGLRRLSGLTYWTNDRQRWMQWWEQNRKLTPAKWQQMLLRKFMILNRRLTSSGHNLEVRLSRALRQVYLSRSQTERSDLLLEWLDDDVPATRLLAMELIEQRLNNVEAPPLDDDLRQALRARLYDPISPMRRRAAEALNNLRDEDAARRVARRLATMSEPDTDTIRAYLKLIRNVPRPEAVIAVIQLLDHPQLRSEAADALAAAVGTNASGNHGLDPVQLSSVASEVRRHLNAVEAPRPSMIRLLGRIAREDTAEDWQIIERFLDHPTDAVKEAAAQAWAESDRPLHQLADRAEDQMIQPLLYEAAIKRGKTSRLLGALVTHKPGLDALQEVWTQAIVATAASADSETVVRFERELAADGRHLELRQELLTRALHAVGPDPNAKATSKTTESENRGPDPVVPAVVVDLQIALAEVRLQNGQATLALESFQDVRGKPGNSKSESLTPAQRERCDLGLLRTYLALGQTDKAVATANPIMTMTTTEHNDRFRRQTVIALVQAAEHRIQTDKTNGARLILELIQSVDSEVVPQSIVMRINTLQKQLATTSPEADGAMATDDNVPLDPEADRSAAADEEGDEPENSN